MPQSFVHIAAVQLLAQRARLPEQALEALQREPALVRLGALLPDLPYFASIRQRALRHLIGLGQPRSLWGELLHHQHPLGVALSLLQPQARSRLGPMKRLALGAGMLSHAALDTALHPQVHALIRAAGLTEPGPAAQRLHQRIEKVQAHWLQQQLLPGLRVAEQIRQADLRAVLTPRIAEHLREACVRIHDRGPGLAQLRDWVAGFAWYARRVAGRPQRAEGGAVDLLAQRAVWFEEPELPALFERALGRAEDWIGAADRAFAPGDVLPAALLELADRFPVVDLDPLQDPFAASTAATGEEDPAGTQGTAAASDH